MNIHQEILNICQATSVLLIFITMIFNLRYNTIVTDIEKELPNGKKARIRERRRVLHSFLINCLPQILFSGIVFYVFLPTVFEIK